MITIDISKIKQARVYLFIVVISFIIYGNSINNEYAIDDNIVLDGVEKVSKGIKGIPEIFTSHYAIDKDQSYDYRPLVLTTFAIEKQFFRKLPAKQSIKEKKQRDKLTQANISHFINVILYAITGIALFNLLQLLFKEYNKLLSLLICFLFIIHPLHTEPVANIKSRDELLMMLGILLALTHYIKFSNTSKYKYLIYASVFVFLSFLSKKTSLALIGIIPVVLYYNKVSFKNILISIATFFLLLVVVALMRRNLLSENTIRDITYIENPLIFVGTFMDRITMGLYCAWFYLTMLIFPKDLSFYYGYNQIPLATWSFYQVWLALLFYVPFGVFGFYSLLKREVLGLGIALWFGVMLAYLNVSTPVVGIVADRFTYVFSLGFCIFLGYLLMKIFKIEMKKGITQVKISGWFLIVFGVITIGYSGRVIARNADWENYITLFRNDNIHLINSAKAHVLLGDYLYKDLPLEQNHEKREELFKEIEKQYLKAIDIYPEYYAPNNNLGTAYFTCKGDLISAKKYFIKAIEIDSGSTETMFNLARTYELIGENNNAENHYKLVIKKSFEKGNNITLAKKSYSYMGMMTVKQNNIKKAFQIYKDAVVHFPQEPEFNFYLANIYLAEHDSATAIKYYDKAFQLNPSNMKLAMLLSKLRGEE